MATLLRGYLSIFRVSVLLRGRLSMLRVSLLTLAVAESFIKSISRELITHYQWYRDRCR